VGSKALQGHATLNAAPMASLLLPHMKKYVPASVPVYSFDASCMGRDSPKSDRKALPSASNSTLRVHATRGVGGSSLCVVRHNRECAECAHACGAAQTNNRENVIRLKQGEWALFRVCSPSNVLIGP